MKKYLLGSLAIALAIGFSSYTSNTAKKQTSNWYSYSGAQTKAARETATNYAKITGSPTCSFGTLNECAVELNESSITPVFTNITFNATSGFPNGNVSGHTDFVANDTKLN